jgi:hypothetical protein
MPSYYQILDTEGDWVHFLQQRGLEFDEEMYDSLFEDEEYEGDDIWIRYYTDIDAFVFYQRYVPEKVTVRNKPKIKVQIWLPADKPYTPEAIHTMQTSYLMFLRKARAERESKFADMYKQIVRENLPSEVYELTVYGTQIEGGKTTVETKQGPQHVHVRSFVLCHNDKNAGWSKDVDDITRLCKYDIDMLYLKTELNPKKDSCILFTVIEQEDRLRGIRATRLNKSNPMGIYMCSDGLGKYLQQHTEELVCTLFSHVYKDPRPLTTSPRTRGQHKAKPREVHYELFAVETAVGFWEHVGFTKTGKTKGKTFFMTKLLCQVDGAPTKRARIGT